VRKLSLSLLAMCVLVLALCAASAAQDFNYPKKPLFVKVPQSAKVPAALPFCGTLSNGDALICYSPPFIRQAYHFPSDLDGSGQTILIVDAFGSPTIQQDLAVFDAVFGLPAPPSFTVYCPDGCPTFNPNNASHGESGWTLETSLDVEYAHAMAPKANLVLVVASTSSGNSLNTAERKAIAKYPGSVLTQSFGIPEFAVRGNNAQLLQAHKN
jgi:subtilase family serine protease